MRKDPTLACLLNLLLPGIGHIYLEQTVKGLIILVVAVGLGFVTHGIGTIFVIAWSMYDAYRIARKNNQSLRKPLTDIEI